MAPTVLAENSFDSMLKSPIEMSTFEGLFRNMVLKTC